MGEHIKPVGATRAVVLAPLAVVNRALVPLLVLMIWTSPGAPIATCTRPLTGLKKVASETPASGQPRRTRAAVVSSSEYRTLTKTYRVDRCPPSTIPMMPLCLNITAQDCGSEIGGSHLKFHQ
jgi:hypothetical protein